MKDIGTLACEESRSYLNQYSFGQKFILKNQV